MDVIGPSMLDWDDSLQVWVGLSEAVEGVVSRFENTFLSVLWCIVLDFNYPRFFCMLDCDDSLEVVLSNNDINTRFG
ncbi:hypothetical protein F2Q68_00007497 [Brassica cretica]|uniref:Uncharacterized protein n=1 Tax=Brassica cretica TaxID=69181 RepID=A0A8S9L0T3_BRACR|nr:hypothetical protein F2Q68_00007497 [Brassica cretica]